ncbi:amino acid ABC transporter substrate-binding protein, PAAT family [Shewanella psychrophila]|uniref:Amino acid ABC transporter substrate-binding protein, PAAT family n=1 Tax=Shewanella psychrophila TaxID=225848 RepID=A0A1S6HVW5_9GAMM|nr:transporter substrate-binding domain-containing protein [Shewanella psychrophila]AQS39717.1 amino acid ABC transporter substrate-binding protein, PAAT family [Shewanella psychrophila]
MRYLLKITLLLMYSHLSLCFADELAVTLAYVEYPPYIGAELENGGPVAEIVAKSYEKIGYQVTLELVPWVRAFRDAKLGIYDGVFTAWHRKEREQWFLFSDSLPPNEIGFYKRKGEDISIQSFDDLKPYQIGVVRGYGYPSGFSEANLKLSVVDTDIQNLRMLLYKRIDLALTDKALGRHFMTEELLGEIEWVEPPIEVLNQYLMISKKAAGAHKLLADFNSGLKQLSDSGELAQILKYHGF